MNLILIRKNGSSITLNWSQRTKRWMVGTCLLMLLSFLAAAFGAGFWVSQQTPDPKIDALRSALDQQKANVAETKAAIARDLDAMLSKVAQLQARLVRLDALGHRVMKAAELDEGEFNFNALPPQGGPDHEVNQELLQALEAPSIEALLNELDAQIASRQEQLEFLEGFLGKKKIKAEVEIAGRPIVKGWMSSPFGYRVDPIHGRRSFHKGVDFAAKEGSPTISVAAGVVSFAGYKPGYGYLVEINHGEGYRTRYGHNKAITVKEGAVVQKGQQIAVIGSTGRSTGPHVHFEVLRNGRQVNPYSYISRVTRK